MQVALVAIVAATVYLRTHIHDHTLEDGTLLSGFLFYTILVMMFNGITELALTVSPEEPCLSCCFLCEAPIPCIPSL